MMRDTSLATYRGIEPTLSPKRAQVLRVIQEYGPMSNQQIALLLGWPINCVTGRTGELVGLGLVEDGGKVLNQLGRTVHVWRAIEKADQKVLSENLTLGEM